MSYSNNMASADLISKEYLDPESATGTMTPRVPVDQLSAKELDDLPFGAIQLSAGGTILQYNNYESRLANLPKDKAIGKNFFNEVAPCTNVREFYGRFQEGVSKKQLHEKFRYHFAFKQNPRDVTITLFYSGITNTVWVFIRPA